MIRLAIVAALALLPVAARAETIRLTPEQADAAIEAGAARRQAADDLAADGVARDRRVHGEVGVAVGTGGYRSFYGIVGVPLGDTGGALLGYQQSSGRGARAGYGDPCRALDSLLCRTELDLDLAAGTP